MTPCLQLDNNRVERDLRVLTPVLAGVARAIKHKISGRFRSLTAADHFRRMRGPLRVSTFRQRGYSASNGPTSVLGHD